MQGLKIALAMIAVVALEITCIRLFEKGYLSIRRTREMAALACRTIRTGIHAGNGAVIPAVVLLLAAAVGSWPYNFYVLMRLVVCVTAVWIGFRLHWAGGYRSWKTLVFAVAVLFNPLAPFHFPKETWRIFNVVSAVAMAPFAFLGLRLSSGADQVTTRDVSNISLSPENTGTAVTEADRILDAAICMLATDEERASFVSFLRERPALMAKFLHSAALLIDKPSCWRFSILFDEIGVALARQGDFPDAATSLACSSLFMKDSPLMWAAKAEVYCEWQDLIAIQYAAKVLRFRATQAHSVDLQQFVSSERGRALLRQARKQMHRVISICQQHPEWRDSYPLKKNAGIADI